MFIFQVALLLICTSLFTVAYCEAIDPRRS